VSDYYTEFIQSHVHDVITHFINQKPHPFILI